MTGPGLDQYLEIYQFCNKRRNVVVFFDIIGMLVIRFIPMQHIGWNEIVVPSSGLDNKYQVIHFSCFKESSLPNPAEPIQKAVVISRWRNAFRFMR